MSHADARRDPYGRSRHERYYAERGCGTPRCRLGCREQPSPAVWARAATMAQQHAVDYDAQGLKWRASRARRIASELQARVEVS